MRMSDLNVSQALTLYLPLWSLRWGRDKARYLLGTSPHPPRLEPDMRLIAASGSALSDQSWSLLCGMSCIRAEGCSCGQPPLGL